LELPLRTVLKARHLDHAEAPKKQQREKGKRNEKEPQIQKERRRIERRERRADLRENVVREKDSADRHQKPIEVIEIPQQVAIPRFSSGPVCLVDGHLARQHLNVSTRQASASLLVARRSNVGSLNFSHVDQGSGLSATLHGE
jgi:hypothetical protein